MKHKAQTILFVLCVLFIKHKAQTSYFNNRYDLFGKADGCSDIYMDGNAYYTCAGGLDASQTRLSLSILKFNLQGNIIASKHHISNQYSYWPGLNNAMNKLNDSLIVNTGYRTDVGYNSYIYIYIYKKNLDSVMYREYGFANKSNVLYNSLIYKQKYIYMVGYVDSMQTNTDILLIKTDTAGNEIWKKKIGVAGMDETGYCIKSSQDGNLIICGNKNIHNNYGSAGAYILKTDTSGSVLWQQWFPTNYGTPANSLEELPNGDILVVSGKGYGFNSTTSQPYSRFQVIKLTATGSLLFNKTYGNTEIATTFYSSITNKKKNIVAVGQKAYADNSVTGVVYEIDTNGDSLFSKEFYNEQGSQNYFRDVVQATDGGYCFAGFISPVFANGGTGSEDIWLLKVDSNFCESAVPCNSNAGLAPLSLREGLGVRIYPNPSTDILNIDIEPLYIGAIAEITNAFGQIVLSQPLVTQQATLNIENLKRGMYYLSIKTKDKTVTQKIILTQ